MIKTVILGALLTLNTTRTTIERLINKAGIRYPKVALAQSIHESGNYKSTLSKKYHNHFGFKNKKGNYKRYANDSLAVADYRRWSNQFINRYHITSRSQFIRKLEGRYAAPVREGKPYHKRIIAVMKTL